jgi:hypothetical protein
MLTIDYIQRKRQLCKVELKIMKLSNDREKKLTRKKSLAATGLARFLPLHNSSV